MIILLSPTKKQERVSVDQTEEPLLFESKKDSVFEVMKDLSFEKIKKDFKVSDTLAKQTLENIESFKENSPALFTYVGEAFKTLNPRDLTQDELAYANDHLLIFSALYGLLKPFNLISKYRLDLMVKYDLNLNEHWKESITDYLNQENRPLINLASNEFSNLIDLNTLNVPIYNIHFQNKNNDVLRVVSSHAKKARGAFAKYLIQNKMPKLETVSVEGYKFSHVEENNYYFIKDLSK